MMDRLGSGGSDETSSPFHDNESGGGVSQGRGHHKNMENLMAMPHNIKGTRLPSLRDPGHIEHGPSAVEKPHGDLVSEGSQYQGVVPVEDHGVGGRDHP